MTFAKTACAAVMLLAGALACSAQIPPQKTCSVASLNGDYAFTIVGQILAPAVAAGLVSGVAMTHFDGQGNLNQVDHVLHAGIAPVEEWRPAIGSYTVNPDCTGTMKIHPQPTDSADSAQSLSLEIVIGDNGNQIRTVVTQPFQGAPFAPAITSIGTKIFSMLPPSDPQ